MGYVQRLERDEEDGHGPHARRKNDTQDLTCGLDDPERFACYQARDTCFTRIKRPAVKQGPDLYLEPKWLRCRHRVLCAPLSICLPVTN